MERWEAGDPERVAMTRERQQRREKYGCAVCKYRGEKIFGRWTCGIGNKPGPRGFCRQWREGDD